MKIDCSEATWPFFLMFHLALLTHLYAENRISVATYNLWNVMFNWDTRQLRIAQMIREADVDIIGFQEVRGDRHGIENQLSELHYLLPQYWWFTFEPANTIAPVDGAYRSKWESEGVGILSRHPLVNHTVVTLPYMYGPDKNKRVALHAWVNVRGVGMVSIIVIHFSYDRNQQCSNAAEIKKYIADNNLKRVIVLGDFNTYKDFESPVQILTDTHSNSNNKCPGYTRRELSQGNAGAALKDSWLVANPGKLGLTFSNMPMPGLESRPDRVLLGQPFRVISAQLSGNGTTYKNKYFIHVVWQRLGNLLGAAYDAHQGKHGRPCLHDCGPHASCRCGLCVSGGDQRACLIPECEECPPLYYAIFIVSLIVLILLVAQLIFAVIVVFYTMNRKSRDQVSTFFGANCCLCNEKLYTQVSVRVRRSRHYPVLRLNPCLKLPPMLLVLVTILSMFILIESVLFVFKEAVDDIYGIIPEELYPSDHLMLTVNVIAV